MTMNISYATAEQVAQARLPTVIIFTENTRCHFQILVPVRFSVAEMTFQGHSSMSLFERSHTTSY